MKLSIIIPAYNADKYLPKLLETLDEQMQEGIEVIIVDDESDVPVKADYPWVKIIRQQNTGPGLARNAGLDAMTGEYFTFIDADDLVTDNYIALVMAKIESGFDYCYLSWKTMPGGWNCEVKLKSVNDTFPPFNLCVWNRVYKTSTFGKHRFSKKRLWAEDADYIYRLNERGKKEFIGECVYLYRDTPNSWTKRMFSGDLDATRIVYNVKTVTEEIRDEILKNYDENEIVLLTNNIKYQELSKKAMILPYNTPMKGTILKGDSYGGFTKIIKPKKTQVVIWTAETGRIGGIETFIYAFCANMSKYYDILVLYDHIAPEQLIRLSQYVECEKRTDKKIHCDTLIVNRITDHNPPNVTFKKKIQMCHICQMGRYNVPKDNDITVYVSEACRKSHDGEGEVIHNLLPPHKCDRVLSLVSATRQTYEKGEKRMIALANELERKKIRYVWLYFTEHAIPNAPKGMIHVPTTLEVHHFIAKADYLVQLSDEEAYGYSIVEALNSGTAVISTPISVLDEINFVGYTVPFDMVDMNVERFLNVPKVDVSFDNKPIIAKWRKVLGNTKPEHKYKPGQTATIRITNNYFDLLLNRNVKKGEILVMQIPRAMEIESKGLGVRE